MDWVHLHLALNHVPVLGTLFILLILITGLIKRSDELIRLSLLSFVVLTAIAIPIKFTGDFAFEASAQQPWMEKSRAEAHEQAADQATMGIFLMGCVAAVGLFMSRQRQKPPKAILIITLILAAATFGLMARTANLGGQIRHEEIRKTSQLETVFFE